MSTTTSKPKAKFQVGDRVRIARHHRLHGEGFISLARYAGRVTLASFSENQWQYVVEFFTGDENSTVVKERYLEAAADERSDEVAPEEVVPKIGDTHWAWDGKQWVPCLIHRVTSSRKSFYCHNSEVGYGSFLPIPVKDWRPTPEFKEKSPKPTPLF